MNSSHHSEKTDTSNHRPGRPGRESVEPMLGQSDPEFLLRKIFVEDPRQGCAWLFNQYYQPLCSHAARFVESQEIAQEIVSDLFNAFWQQQLYLMVTSSFRAYLFTSVQKRCVGYLQNDTARADLPVQLLICPAVGRTTQPMQSSRAGSKGKPILPLFPAHGWMNRKQENKLQELVAELNHWLKTLEAHIAKALMALRKSVG